MRRLAALLLLVLGACGDNERQGLTADSAVLQSGQPAPDSTAANVGGDTVRGAGDSPTVDSVALHNPVMVLVADSVAGDELFRRKGKCLSCHGLAGKGLERLGPNLQDSVWLHGDGSFAFIRRTIIEGIARPKESNFGMPAFGRGPGADASVLSTTLAPEEIYRIAAYVYTLSHPGSAVADTTTIVPDSTAVPPDSVRPPVPPPAVAMDSASGSHPATPSIR